MSKKKLLSANCGLIPLSSSGKRIEIVNQTWITAKTWIQKKKKTSHQISANLTRYFFAIWPQDGADTIHPYLLDLHWQIPPTTLPSSSSSSCTVTIHHHTIFSLPPLFLSLTLLIRTEKKKTYSSNLITLVVITLVVSVALCAQLLFPFPIPFLHAIKK